MPTRAKMSVSVFKKLFLAVSVSQVMSMLLPESVAALARWSGIVSLEDAYAETQQSNSNLLQTGLNIDYRPPVKNQLNTRFNVRMNFMESDHDRLWNISPIGNLGVDLSGQSYVLNLAHSNYATVSTTAQLVETKISRAAFNLDPQDFPRISSNYSSTITSSNGVDSQADTRSIFTDYRYKWLNFRGGYSSQERTSATGLKANSDTLFAGSGGSYTILPDTNLSGDIDLNRNSGQSSRGLETSTMGTSMRLNLNSRPVFWLGLDGNLSMERTDFDAVAGSAATSAERRNMDMTSRLLPWRSLELSSTLGQREFDDVDKLRSVSFWTVAAAFNRAMYESVRVGSNLAHTTETDPDQGDNIRDNFGVNATMDLTPRMSARANVNVGRSEIVGFVNTSFYNVAGTLAERELEDDRPAGFIFFDTQHNDLYTKNSLTPGDWSDPMHIEPVVGQYSVSRTLQLNLIPTDKTSIVLSYSSNFNAASLDFIQPGGQTINGSLSYQANLRTNYSLTTTANLPQSGDGIYGGTMSMSYRFFRGHRAHLSYGRHYAPTRLAGFSLASSKPALNTDSFSASIRFDLTKGNSLDFNYSASALFSEEQTNFIRARWSKSF